MWGVFREFWVGLRHVRIPGLELDDMPAGVSETGP